MSVNQAGTPNCNSIDSRCLTWQEPLFTPSTCHGIDLDGNVIEDVSLAERPLDTFCRQWFSNADAILDIPGSVADLQTFLMRTHLENGERTYSFHFSFGSNPIPGTLKCCLTDL
jgi:hypothetical protein